MDTYYLQSHGYTNDVYVTNNEHHYQSHDSSIAVIKNGRFISFLEEERFSRVRHSPNRFPYKSLRFALNEIDTKNNIVNVATLDECKYSNFNFSKLLQQKYNINYYPFDGNKHHLSHAYYTFYNSGFKHASVLVVDGKGTENDSITLYHAEENKSFKELKKYSKDISPGRLYHELTKYIGYKEFDEGKTMGLSSYGTSDLSIPLYKFQNDMIYCENWKEFFNKIYPYTKKTDDIEIIHYANLTATIQYNFNQIILYVLKELKEYYPEETNLCLCGGCFLNGIVNNLIIKENLFEYYFCPPWTDDSGTSIGKAYMITEQNNIPLISERVIAPFYGTEIKDKDIEKISNIEQITEDEIVELIYNNAIIGWVQGRSEMGPRALGHRSIIANPSNRELFYKINNTIKHRENWRPLAPIVPEELFDMLFVVESNNHDLFEFMLRMTNIKKEWKNKISAVCHVDGTTRPQLLKKDTNPELYNIMLKLWNKYEIPCLINTSLNDRGEPIIETIEDALNFINKISDLDCLIFNGKYILKRK